MADPSDLHAYDELQAKLKQPIRLALVGEADLLKTLDAVYRQTDEIASLAEAVRDDLQRERRRYRAALGGGELARCAGHQAAADDVQRRHAGARLRHPHRARATHKLRIRLRVDGVLQEQVIDGRRVASALVTRLKLMCGLDIAEKRLPQDGRFSMRVRDAAVDVRLATMPTTHGESVVMRLLSQSTALMSLEKLGMPATTEARFRRLVERTCRHGPGDRAHRQRQDHDALRGAQSHQQAGRESNHGRGSGRIPARPHHAGAGAAEDRPRLRTRAAHGAAPGSRHHPGRRDARPRDGRDRSARRDDRPLRVLDAAHHQRRRQRQPAARHGCAGLHDRRGGSWRRRAATGASRLH